MQPRGVKMSASRTFNQNHLMSSTQTLFWSPMDEIWALGPRFCVNPKELEAGENSTQKLKSEVNSKQPIIRDEICGSLKNKDALTHLEKFQDLTSCCLPITGEQIMTDNTLSSGELNTPQYEKGEFGYTKETSNENSQFDHIRESGNQFTEAGFDGFMTKYQEEQYVNKNEQEPLNKNLHNSGGTMIDNFENNNNIYTNITPADNPPWNLNNNNNSIIDTIQNAEVIFSNELINTANYVVKQEENSLEVQNKMKDADKENLRLDFTNILNVPSTSIVDTPEVIRNALSLGQDEFSLVNFINYDEIQENSLCSTINDDTIPQCISTNSYVNTDDTSTTINDDTISQCTSTNSYTYTDDTSDSDFEPSNKRRKTSKKQTNRNVQTSEDIYPKKRGRPSKRRESQHSVSSSTNGNSRYREMRDKNNEASRKSRLNRKMKEQQMEDEANKLEEKNNRLKIQVEYLDKLVNNMREGLMQLMLKK